MSRLQQVLKAALLLFGSASLFALTALLLQTMRLERETFVSVELTLGKVRQTSTEANRLLLETGLTMKNLREASASWKSSSEAQAAATTLVVESVNTDLRKIGALIDHTDETLNVKIGPETMAVLHAFGGTVESLDADAKALRPVLDSTAEAAKNAANATGKLPEVVENVNATAKNVADVAADTHRATNDMANYVHTLVSPKKSIVGIAKAILEVMYKIKLVLL